MYVIVRTAAMKPVITEIFVCVLDGVIFVTDMEFQVSIKATWWNGHDMKCIWALRNVDDYHSQCDKNLCNKLINIVTHSGSI